MKRLLCKDYHIGNFAVYSFLDENRGKLELLINATCNNIQKILELVSTVMVTQNQPYLTFMVKIEHESL
jgi:hypothetical protein